MRKIIYIIFAFLLLNNIEAQQLPQYTQYMLNEFAINPAFAGKEQYADVRSNNRYQWVGINDAPRTNILTVNGPMKVKNMGLGMNLFTDVVGPTRRIGLNFSYAYHIKLNEENKVALGLSAGILQWGIDGHKLQLHDAGDESLLTQYQTTYVPDFGAGVLVYGKKYYLGISAPQLYQSKINLYSGVPSRSKLVSHLNVNAAYKFDLGEDFKIEPSFLLKYASPAPLKLDVGVRGIYQDQVWLGCAYRHNDAITALVGYMFKNYLMIGYSYDITTTNIRRYTTGTHELMLGLRFSKAQNRNWKSEAK